MPYTSDPRVDASIDGLPGWQQDICREIRDLVHAVDPEVTEKHKALFRVAGQRLLGRRLAQAQAQESKRRRLPLAQWHGVALDRPVPRRDFNSRQTIT